MLTLCVWKFECRMLWYNFGKTSLEAAPIPNGICPIRCPICRETWAFPSHTDIYEIVEIFLLPWHSWGLTNELCHHHLEFVCRVAVHWKTDLPLHSCQRPAYRVVCETWGGRGQNYCESTVHCSFLYITIQCTCPMSFFEQWQYRELDSTYISYVYLEFTTFSCFC